MPTERSRNRGTLPSGKSKLMANVTEIPEKNYSGNRPIGYAESCLLHHSSPPLSITNWPMTFLNEYCRRVNARDCGVG